MCECLKKIAENASVKYTKNDKAACVKAQIKGEVTITQWVMENRPHMKKVIRRSKSSKYEGIEFKFCPICGEPNTEYQLARVWDS